MFVFVDVQKWKKNNNILINKNIDTLTRVVVYVFIYGYGRR